MATSFADHDCIGRLKKIFDDNISSGSVWLGGGDQCVQTRARSQRILRQRGEGEWVLWPIRSQYLCLSANQKPVFVGEWGAGGPGWPGRLLQANGGHEGEFSERVLLSFVIFFSPKVAHNSSLRSWLRQLRQCALGARSVTNPGLLRRSLNYL